jgi:hypothetical protein
VYGGKYTDWLYGCCQCNFKGLRIILLVLQTTEYYHTVRDSEGNEATTVTQQIGDQRYSVTTHTDFKGEKQQTERFKNIEKGKITVKPMHVI